MQNQYAYPLSSPPVVPIIPAKPHRYPPALISVTQKIVTVKDTLQISGILFQSSETY